MQIAMCGDTWLFTCSTLGHWGRTIMFFFYQSCVKDLEASLTCITQACRGNRLIFKLKLCFKQAINAPNLHLRHKNIVLRTWQLCKYLYFSRNNMQFIKNKF